MKLTALTNNYNLESNLRIKNPYFYLDPLLSCQAPKTHLQTKSTLNAHRQQAVQ